MKIVQKRFNSGYAASLQNETCRERYAQTFSLLVGADPYEETQWEDDIRHEACSHVCACLHVLYHSLSYSVHKG